MQGQKESPPDMQCKDKFLLQSVVAPDEESDEGSSPSRPSVFENGDQDTSLLDAVSKSLEEPKEKSSETWSMISRLTEEKLLPCLQQNQKLRHALLAMESYEKETWLDLRDVNQEFYSLEKSKMGVQGIRKAVMS
ncbi:hypothetical protein D5086_025739 [Populus alba]|uniref:Uncharacterized protein n=1 Tax=Populus alba TaxID=43335 RepID=A0ACC4B015_POPAL